MFVHDVGSGFDAEGRFYVTSPTGYRIDVYDADGRHVRAITRDYRAQPISATTVEELRERTHGHFDTAFAHHRITEAFAFDDERRLRQLVLRMEARRIDAEAEAPLPPLLPPIGALRVSADGSFWVQRVDVLTPVEYRLHGFGSVNGWPALPTTWDVFDPAGRFLGPVVFPPRFQLMHVRGTEATGVQKDSLGVEYVVTWRVGGTTDRLELRRPAGPR
jgi:hypothetical protein